jgi:DNA-binding MarR family transcriptional regulator
LAVIEQVKPPTMVRIVRALTEQGLATAKPDKQDRRKIVISATARGSELMLRARQRRVHALAALIAGISQNEQEGLRSAVGIIRQLLGGRK